MIKRKNSNVSIDAKYIFHDVGLKSIYKVLG